MDEKMQIEEITYERERLDFFTELMKLAQTRYNLLHRRFKDAPYLSEAHQTLSDMGREIHFFGDIVEMLEKGYCKPTEWISVDERLPKERERVLVVCEDGVVRMNMIKHGYFPKITNIERISVKTTHWMPLPEPPKGEGNES